jgi:hypothetical protein
MSLVADLLRPRLFSSKLSKLKVTEKGVWRLLDEQNRELEELVCNYRVNTASCFNSCSVPSEHLLFLDRGENLTRMQQEKTKCCRRTGQITKEIRLTWKELKEKSK